MKRLNFGSGLKAYKQGVKHNSGDKNNAKFLENIL